MRTNTLRSTVLCLPRNPTVFDPYSRAILGNCETPGQKILDTKHHQSNAVAPELLQKPSVPSVPVPLPNVHDTRVACHTICTSKAKLLDTHDQSTSRPPKVKTGMIPLRLLTYATGVIGWASSVMPTTRPWLAMLCAAATQHKQGSTQPPRLFSWRFLILGLKVQLTLYNMLI